MPRYAKDLNLEPVGAAMIPSPEESGEESRG